MRLRLVAVALFCLLPIDARQRVPVVRVDEYERTLNALVQYRLLAAQDDGARLPETGKAVEPGEHYAGVPRLIRLLTLLGDLPVDNAFQDSDRYDGPLVVAVQRFQLRHGLDPTGWIDQTTLAQLNTPLAFRVRQLELAAERWRRNPYDPTRPVIILNLPEYRLRAYRANRLELEMKIVIGRSPERKTPLLCSDLESIIFRPYWNVPMRIQREELVPELRKDPSYLSSHDFEMVTEKGDVVREPVSRSTVGQLAAGNLRLRQIPGAQNALGLAKFVFPNEYDVYMHDTPVRSAFWRSRRDLSHGCIRVERAAELAAWVLREQPGWSAERIAAAMEGTDSVLVKLSQPIQLVTVYATAVVLDNGEVHFFDDIYREDEAFEKEMLMAESPAFRRR
jgi:murein L,D-transpeptidase YcbB/YkuD